MNNSRTHTPIDLEGAKVLLSFMQNSPATIIDLTLTPEAMVNLTATAKVARIGPSPGVVFPNMTLPLTVGPIGPSDMVVPQLGLPAQSIPIPKTRRRQKKN